jgi:hypothetical protein
MKGEEITVQNLLFEPEAIEAQARSLAYPKLNPDKPSNYFAQVAKAIRKNWPTCTRSYGLFIEGEPEAILAWLKECYKAHNDHLDSLIEQRLENSKPQDFTSCDGYLSDYDSYVAYIEKFNRKGFWYFINTDPRVPGLIYYGPRQGRQVKEVKEGEVVGYATRSNGCFIRR